MLKHKTTMFPKRLLAARKAMGLTQMELAEASGLQVPAMSNFERGKTEPRLESFARLVVALNVSADYLLGLDDE